MIADTMRLLERLKQRAAISKICALGLHEKCGGGLVTQKIPCQCDCHKAAS